MKKIQWMLLVLLAVLSISFVACGDKDEPTMPAPTPTPTPTVAKIEFPETENIKPVFRADGGTATVTFTTNQAWVASISYSNSDGWVTITPDSGEPGVTTLKITTSANESPDDRKATIAIKSGLTGQANIYVTQVQRDAIIVASEEKEISYRGGALDFDIQTNVSFSVDVDVDWITTVDTRALHTETLHFDVKANEDFEIRTGTITISGNEVTQSVKVIQFGKPQGNYNQDEEKVNFEDLFTHIYMPYSGSFGSNSYTHRADNFGYIMAAISLDSEGADFSFQDNSYNWFSVTSELSSRNANYINPLLRYAIPYSHIEKINSYLDSFSEGTTDKNWQNKMAQARALRAYAYMALAPYYQFGYATSADQPCIPLITTGVDLTNNPRATSREVWNYILDDLNYAIENLNSGVRDGKAYIDQNVAYGLRARANLYVGNWAGAASDAAAAAQGYEPASMSEVSVPAFFDINDHNWMWGADITEYFGQNHGYQTPSSWISAFSGDGYAAATQNTPQINTLLWNKIPETDVRKGWWIDENLHSPNWAQITWKNIYTGSVLATGDEIATLVTDDDGKMALLPYTNIKFGQKSGAGSFTNDNDFPLMRVEEMILIQAEGLAKSGNQAQAIQILENFVRTYRDPDYSVNGRGLSLADEIWFQRRVELWGEGFFTFDMKRLGKPLVRFHGPNSSNLPKSYQFNIKANDGWLNMRFPQIALDGNRAIVDNTGGSNPYSGQNPDLRDGVTD